MRMFLKRSMLASTLCVSSLIGHLAEAGFYEDAQQKIVAGDAPAAIIYLKNLLQKQPDHIEGRALLGTLLANGQECSAAVKEIQRALELGAESLSLGEPLLRCQIQQQQWQEALNTLDQRWPEGHRSAERLLYLGDIQLGMALLRDAESSYDRVLELEASSRATFGLAMIAKRKGELSKALGILEPILVDPVLGQQAALLKIEILLDKKQAGAAMEILEPLIAEQPNSPVLILLHAQTYAIRQDFDQVQKYLAKLPDVYRQNSKYLLLSAFAALGQRDYDAAYQYSNNLLLQQPNNPQALLLTGMALHLAGEHFKAEKHLSHFVEQVPYHLNGRLMLAASQQALEKPSESLQTLQPILDLDEPPSQARGLAGYAYIALGDWEKGEQLLSEAMADNPQLENLRNSLAMSQIMQGKTDLALGLLENADQPVLQQDALRVTAYVSQHQHDQALDFLSERQQQQPDNPAYLLLAGMVYLNLQAFEQAQVSYEAAIDIDPDSLAARFALIRLHLQQQRPVRAQQYVNEILKREPSNLNALMSMAMIAGKTEGEASMLSWLEQAKQRNNQSLQPVIATVRYYLVKQRNDKARTEAHGFYLAHPDMPGAIALYTHTLRALGNTREALKYASRLVQRYPNNIGYLRLLAEIHLDLGDPVAALKYSQRAMDLNPELSANLLLFSRVLQAGSQAIPAEDYARQLLGKQNSPLTERIMGMVLMSRGKPTEALPHLQAAAKAQSDSVLMAALADAWFADGQPKQAISVLTAFLKDNPNMPQTHLHLAKLLYASGQVDQALKENQALTDNYPEHPAAWNNLAWILMEQGDPRSLLYARKALALAPEDANVLDTVGWVLLQAGEEIEALDLLAKAAKIKPGNPEVQFHYAKALVANNQLEQAEDILSPMSGQSDHQFSQQAAQLLTEIR